MKVKENNFYEVSNLGRVRSIDRIIKKRKFKGMVLKSVSLKGYPAVSICDNGKRKLRKVRRLVAEAFICNKDNKATVNHIDCNKENNNIKNLEWASHLENIRHAYREIDGFGKPSMFDDMQRLTILTFVGLRGTNLLSEYLNVPRITIQKIKQGKNGKVFYKKIIGDKNEHQRKINDYSKRAKSSKITVQQVWQV